MTTTEQETNTPEERAADGSPAGIEEEAIPFFPFDAEKISISNQVLSIEALIRRLNQGAVLSATNSKTGQSVG